MNTTGATNEHVSEWIPLSKAAEYSPYSSEYLSLLARKGRLTAKKINGVWHTTRAIIEDYLRQQAARAELHNKNPDTYRPFISDAAPVPVTTPVKEEAPATSVSVSQVTPEVTAEAHVVEPVEETTQKTDAVFVEFMRKFNTYIDERVEAQHGIWFRITRFVRRSFKAVFSSKKLLAIFLVLLVLSVLSPIRFVSGFAETFLRGAVGAVKDAQTVMGFRPGTHENEILLLGPEGEISIFGSVETDGQFKSFVEEGIAPIVVTSTTKAENLNVDYLDDLSSEEFTLAFVTKNGNVTFEDVFLEGNVEVGSTLLVRGATRLLQSLQVDGNLSVLGDAVFNRSLTVLGNSTFKDMLTAQDVIVERTFRVKGESTFEEDATFEDDVNIEGSIKAYSGVFENTLRVHETFSALRNVSLGNDDGAVVRVNSDDWSVDNEGNATFESLTVFDAAYAKTLAVNGEGTFGGVVTAPYFVATSTSATSTFAGNIALTGAFYDGTNDPGTNGYVLQTTGTSTEWVATSTLGISGALTDDSVTPDHVLSTGQTDEYCLTYELTGDTWEWQTCGSGSSLFTDGGDTTYLTSTDNLAVGTSSSNARFSVQATSTNPILSLFETSGGEVFTVLESGNVGIGTSSPSQELTVAGNAYITGALYDSTNSAGSNGEILQSTGSGTTWVATSSLGFDSGITSLNGLTASTQTFATSTAVDTFGFVSNSSTHTLTIPSNVGFFSNDAGYIMGNETITLSGDVTGSGTTSIATTISTNAVDESMLNVNAPMNEYILVASSTSAGGFEWVATSTARLGLVGQGDLHDAVTLAGTRDYLTISGQEITRGEIDISDDTNLGKTGTPDYVTLTGDNIVVGTVDVSDDTNLSVTATGLELSGDAVALASGYTIPLTASTTNWNSFYDTPSTRITAGDALTWSSNTLNFDGGNTPGGELGGTWASPTVDAEITTLEELSDVDTFTQSAGDIIYWDGDSWANTATTTWNTDTQLTEEQVEDFVGGMLGGTETLITVTYQDSTNDIDFVVDGNLSNYTNDAGFITGNETITLSGDVTGSGTTSITTTIAANAVDESMLNVNAPTNGYILVASSSATGGWEWTATSSSNLGLVGQGDLHDQVTLAGEDYLSLTGQQITANAINPDNLSNSDFGDFSCDGTTCSFDTNTVTTDELDLSIAPTWTGEHVFSATSTLATTTIAELTLGSALAATSGGTGNATYSTGDILYASDASTLTRLPIGTAGEVLKVVGGLPSWEVDNTGGGGGSGLWATTTSELLIYPADTSDIVVIGNNATSSNTTIFEVQSGDAYFESEVSIGTTTVPARLSVQSTGTNDIFNLFETGGSEVFTVLESGNVGIGTSSPSRELTVAGDAYITGALYDSTNSAGSNGEILQSTGSGTTWVATSSLGFDSGITSLNGLTASTQTFATSTAADTFGFISNTSTHTLTIPSNVGFFSNDAGYITGNETITLSGDVTGSGTTSITTTIAANAVDESMLNVNAPTDEYILVASSTAGGGFEWVATSSLGFTEGTVTSVAASVPTGWTISGSPITDSGTLAFDYDTGYAAVLTASTTNWNDFYDTPSTRITAGDALTWSSNTLNFDGGNAPGGELGGTWASPTVDAEITTLEELSDVDTFTQSTGDVIYWDGDSWANTATTSWDTDTQLTEEQVEDFVGGMLGGTETLITVTYQDSTNDIDFVVDNDLANYSNTNANFFDTAGTNLNSTGSTINLDDSITLAGTLTVTGTSTLATTTTTALTATTLTIGGDTFDELVGTGLQITDGDLQTTLGTDISESELSINAPTNGYILIASSSATGGWEWTATTSSNLGLVQQSDLHDPVTLAGARDYLTISGQEITRGEIDISDDTNLAKTGTPDYVTLTGDNIVVGTVDISDDTNLSVTATGLELSGDAVALSSGYTIPLTASTTEWDAAYASTTALTPTYIRGLFSNTATGLTYNNATGETSLTAGYSIPLTASTTNWNDFYDTPSTRITAGDGLEWATNTLNVNDVTAAMLVNGDFGDFSCNGTICSFDTGTVASSTLGAENWAARYILQASTTAASGFEWVATSTLGFLSDITGQSLEDLSDVDTFTQSAGDVIYWDGDSWANTATTSWDTDTQLTEEQVEDFVGGMLGGTETLITVTYQDSTNDIDFVVDGNLSNYTNDAGFITGNETITLSGDVTGSGTTSIATAIAADSIVIGDIADGDWGDFTISSNNASLDANTVTTDELDLSIAPTWTGEHVFSATSTLATTTISSLTLGEALSVANGGTGATTLGAGEILLGNGTSAITSTSTLAQGLGGTGQSSYTSGDILYADGSGNLARLGVGSTGQVLKVAAGLPSWGADETVGAGGGDGVWATTTDFIYPQNTSYRVLIGTNATATVNSIFEVSGNSYFSNNVGIGDTSPTALFTVGSGDAFQVNSGGAIAAATGITSSGSITFSALTDGFLRTNGSGVLSTSTIDISDDTNLSVTATGLELSGDAVALSAGYNIPLTASTTNWNDFYDTPSTRVTAGTGLSWDGNTLNNNFDGTVSTSTNLVDTYITYATGADTIGAEAAFTYDDATNLLTVENYIATNGTTTNATSTNLATTNFVIGGDTFDELVGTGLQITSGDLQTTLGTDISESELSIGAPTDGYLLIASSSATGGWEWTATTSSNLGLVGQEDLHDQVTLAGTRDYLTISGQEITRGEIDISDDTNLSVTATGLELSGDAVALSAGYSIPLTASTTNWNTFYDTPSTRITAGDALTWSSNTLNFDGGNTPGGELGGTWASPTVDAEITTLEELSDVDTFTQSTGDVIYWDGDSWANTATTSWDTNTQLTEEQVEDFVGGMVTGNTETLITVTYEDSDGTIDFVVDGNLSNYTNDAGFITGNETITLSGDVTGSGTTSITTTIAANAVDESMLNVNAPTNGYILIASSSATGGWEWTATSSSNLGLVGQGDLHDAVTLAGAYDYLTLSGQEITLNQIDLATDVTGVLPVADGGTGTTTLNNLITLGTHTTGNYVATIADAGNSTITVNNSGTENAAVTLDVIDVNCVDCLNATEIADIYVLNAGDTIDGELTVTGTSTLATTTATALTATTLTIGGDTFDELVGTGLQITDGDLQTTLGVDISESELSINAPTNGYILVASSSATGGWEWTATTSSNLGLVQQSDLHDPVTLAGARDYLTISGQEITRGEIDISDDTNLSVTATGLELSGDAVALSAGYSIPLTASTTNWNDFYDTPSTRITAGDALTWSSNTLNFDGGNAPGGELGGTWASPTVDAEITTLEELSDVDTFTQSAGDVIYWDGDSWANTATTSWDTNTQLTEEEVEDFVGGMLGGTETGITVTYQDGTNDIDFVVDNLENLAGTLDVSSGGTGATTLGAGEILLGNGTSAITSTSTLSAALIEDAFLRNDGDTATGDYTFDIDTLFIDSTNDRIGIGTTTPEQQLHVDGNALFGSGGIGSGGVGNNIFFNLAGGGNNRTIQFSSNTISSLFTNTGGTGADLILQPTAGNVGIGTSSPSELLHVAGDTRIEGALYDGNNSAGNNGEILQSTGTGIDWVATSSLGFHDPVTLAGAYDYLTLSGQEITLNQIDLTTDVTGTLPVSSGGTGATTLTDHGVLVGSGTGAVTALSVGTNGQLLIGSTGADPVFATLNCADALTCTTGAGTLEIDFDGGATPGGELGGTWASPTVDAEITTLEELSDVDTFTQSTGDVIYWDGDSWANTATTTWDTDTQLTEEQVEDFVGGMLGGTETGITVTYQDGTNDIDFVVDNLENLAGTLDVSSGGTGATTLTDGGVLLGSGTGAITALSVLGDGVIIVGDNVTDPTTIQLLTSAAGTVRHEVGGLEADVSAYTGLVGISGGATSEVDTEAELETHLGSLDVVTVTTDDITSANLATLLSNETGSGNAVFSSSPTFTGTAVFANYTATNGTTTNATSTNLATTNFTIGGDTFDELVGTGLQITSGDLQTTLGTDISESELSINAPTNGYLLIASSSATGGWEWTATTSSNLGLVQQSDLHDPVTLAGTRDYLTISGQEITRGEIDISDDTNLGKTGTPDYVSLTGDNIVVGTVDVSDDTNLSVTATGLELSGDAVALSSGYTIPLTASTTNWNTFYDTPSSRITAGDALTWSSNTLNFDGGNAPGGELGGTWASPTVDAEITTLEELSDVDTFTQSAGDVLYWTGTGWNATATTTWDTDTQLTEEQVEDFVGGMLGGTETGITVTYQDGTNDIDFVVDNLENLAGTLDVASGGTGATTLGAGEILLGNGTSAITSTSTLSAALIEDAFLRNDGDTATGDYTFDTDTLFIDSTNDRVGIGTTSPDNLLHVEGTGATPLTLARTGSSLNANMEFRNDAGSVYTGIYNTDFAIGPNQDLSNSPWVYIDGGNVGIGTTSPAHKLDIVGTGGSALRIRGADAVNEIADLFVGGAGNFTLDLRNGNDTSQYIDLRTEDDQFGLILRESDGTGTSVYGNFYVTDDTDDRLSIGVGTGVGSLPFHITASGNVGIGTTGPGKELSLYVNDTDTDGQVVIEQDGSGDTGVLFAFTGVKNWIMGVDNSDSDKFKIENGNVIGGSNDFVIDSSGNVGIGVSSPSDILEVVGTASTVDGLFVQDPTASAYGARFMFDDTNSLAIIGTRNNSTDIDAITIARDTGAISFPLLTGGILETNSSGVLSTTTVAATDLSSADFGDFTCNGTTCSLDTNSVGDNEINYSEVTLNDLTNDTGYITNIASESFTDLSDTPGSFTANRVLYMTGSAVTSDADLTFDGANLSVGGNLAVAGASTDNNRMVNADGTLSNDSDTYGLFSDLTYSGSLTANRVIYGTFSRANLSGYTINGNNLNANGVWGEVQVADGNNAVNVARGLFATIDQNNTTNAIADGRGVSVFLDTAASSEITTASGLYVNIGNSGTMGTTYGIYLNDIVEGTQTEAYAFWTNEGDMVLDGDGDGIAGTTTSNGSDLFFGEGQDAAIWYDGTDFNIDPDLVGSGSLKLIGDVSVGTTFLDNISLSGGNVVASNGSMDAISYIADGFSLTPTFRFDGDTDTGLTYPGADQIGFTAGGTEIAVVSSTGIDLGSGQFLAPNGGTAAAPAFAFTDSDTGIYRAGSDVMGLSTGGSQRLEVDSAGLELISGQILGIQADTAAAPSYTFSGDNDTGMYRSGAGDMGFSGNGTLIAEIRGAGILEVQSEFQAPNGGNTDPTFTFASDTDTGLFRAGSDVLNFATAGTDRGRFTSNGTFRVANLTSCSGIQTNASGNMSCTSDEQLKDIHTPFTAGLDAVNGIDPQSYSWKESYDEFYDGGALYHGFVAQNVESVLPEAVNIGAMGYRQVSFNTILAASVNAIKELDIKIEDLTSSDYEALRTELFGGEETVNSETNLGTESEVSEFALRFFENTLAIVTDFLADANNGLAELFAQKIVAENIEADTVTTRQLCLDDICVTKSELADLLAGVFVNDVSALEPDPVSDDGGGSDAGDSDPVTGSGSSDDPASDGTSAGDDGSGAVGDGGDAGDTDANTLPQGGDSDDTSGEDTNADATEDVEETPDGSGEETPLDSTDLNSNPASNGASEAEEEAEEDEKTKDEEDNGEEAGEDEPEDTIAEEAPTS